MAQKRMFSLQVIETDKFLDMPTSAQALYFHLGMHGDDDGFVGSPKKITRSVGCNDDDLRLLAAKGFVIPFDSGVVVITDWNINNTLKNDRYHETVFVREKSQLFTDNSGRYSLGTGMEPKRIQVGTILEPEPNITQHNITKPNPTKVNAFCEEPKIVSPPVITLPLNDGTEYSVFQNQRQEWETLYPAVDVMQQLRNMRGWLLSNPDKRKTKRGIQRFITAWLAKDQDRGGSRANSRPAPSDEKNYDVLGLMGVKISMRLSGWS